MAEQYNRPSILLGFVDAEIFGKDAVGVDFKVNKIGGNPDWPAAGYHTPICKGCKASLVLIVQMYAPVSESPDHRTLYFFACLAPPCWGTPHSWVCVRVHHPATPEPQPTPKLASVPSQDSASLFDVPNDWDCDSEDENDNDDSNANNSLDNYCGKNTLQGNANLNLLGNSLEETPTEGIEELSNTATTSNNLNLNTRNANTLQMHSNTATLAMERLNLNQGNGNGAVGATATPATVETEDVPSAVIEGAEGDMVAVDSPDSATQDISLWFKTPQLSPTWSAPESLCPYFIRVDYEKKPSNARKISNGELLQKYSRQQLEEDAAEDASSDGNYVKAVPVHGDILMHKFQKKIADAPDQILRYCRDTGSGPLLLRRLPHMDTKCGECGSALVFEAQVMPQLIPFLHPRLPNLNAPLECAEAFKKSSAPPLASEKAKSNSPARSTRSKLDKKFEVSQQTETKLQSADERNSPQNKASSVPASGIIEYGTVLLFSCSTSCWKGKQVQEVCVVQEEVIQ